MTIHDVLGSTTGRPSYIAKGWGYELIAVNNQEYCGKLLHFVAGRKCSLHYHKQKSETFFLHKGKMEVYYSDHVESLMALLEKTDTPKQSVMCTGADKIHNFLDKFILTQGMTFEVPVGRVHQMVALEDSELFEFSTQDFAEDSYRLLKGD